MWNSGDFDRRWLVGEVGELTLHSHAFVMQTIANGSGGAISQFPNGLIRHRVK